ncbi:c-type cytochrome [Noviherbaspirillum galbum]|uniref:C-type cytochrome n=1 Tax=Noviherbaspirillum galbum TaxID=2709383 RepID=A0A6B3SWL6_9BURK|nr:c-type cytochrome [Noviherbaspirillum galbum]NEX64921.1 c-type cytochrome [Noviherbaspirillum galbum]
MKKLAIALLVLALAGAAVAAGIVYSGVVNVAATEPHLSVSYYVLHYAMRRSVIHHARDIQAPPLEDAARIGRGAVLYRQHCVQCHGGPGVAPEALGYGVRPVPTNLAEDERDWEAREVYWIIRHGVRLSAMPAWEYRLSEEEMWDLTAFVKQLSKVSPQDYMQMTAPPPRRAPPADRERVPPGYAGNAAAGKFAMEQYLCATCHEIPGVVGADKNVGPSLKSIAGRAYIGGVLRNSGDNMVRWLRNPQHADPLSAMPNLQVSERDARDMAAYLATLTDP